MTKTARSIWFALADDGSGAVSPVNWRGRMTILAAGVVFLGSAFVPLFVSEAMGIPGLSALGLVMPFFAIIPFLFLIRAHLDTSRTRSQLMADRGGEPG